MERESSLCSGRKFSNISPAVNWKIENVPNKLCDLAKEISLVELMCLVASFYPMIILNSERGDTSLTKDLNKKHSFITWQRILKSRNGFQAI